MKAKQIITTLIVGLIGGIAGALIFEPIDGFTDILLSDYAIGGVITGGVIGFVRHKASTLGKLIMYGVGIGVVIFLVFGLISGRIVDDIIAGILIGLFVALATHYLSPKVRAAVEAVDDKIEELTDKDEA